MVREQIVEFSGKLYQLVRSIKVEQVNDNMEGLKAWRDYLHCDHVLKYNDHFLMGRNKLKKVLLISCLTDFFFIYLSILINKRL